MTTIETARNRAEELLQNLQKKAKELLEAEDSVVKTVRTLVEERGFSPGEVESRLEDLVGRIKASRVWDRVKSSDALAGLQDYRGEVERRVEDSILRVLHALSLATKSELADLNRQVIALNKKVNELSKKVEGQS